MSKLSTARAKALAAKRAAVTETRQTTKDAIWCEGYDDYAPGVVMDHPYTGDEAHAYSEGWRAASEMKPSRKPDDLKARVAAAIDTRCRIEDGTKTIWRAYSNTWFSYGGKEYSLEVSQTRKGVSLFRFDIDVSIFVRITDRMGRKYSRAVPEGQLKELRAAVLAHYCEKWGYRYSAVCEAFILDRKGNPPMVTESTPAPADVIIGENDTPDSPAWNIPADSPASDKPQTVAVHMLDSDTVRHVPAVKASDVNFVAFVTFGFPETRVPAADALPGYRVATCEKSFHRDAEFMAMPDDDPRDFNQYEKDMRILGTTLARDGQEDAAATPTPIEPETRADGQAGPVSADYTGLEARIVARAMADNAEFAEKVLSQYRELQEKVAPRSTEERVNDKKQQLGGALAGNAIYREFMKPVAPFNSRGGIHMPAWPYADARHAFKAWYSAVRKVRREQGDAYAHLSQHDGLGLLFRCGGELMEWGGIQHKTKAPPARAELFARFNEVQTSRRMGHGKATIRYSLRDLRKARARLQSNMGV